MKMRQGLNAALISLASLALVSLTGCSEPVEEAPAKTSAPAPAEPPAPVIVTPAAEPVSDAVALSEEAVDKVEAEKAELATRAADLQTQVEDGEMIIAMKAKQIKDLEAQLKQAQAESKK